MRKRDRLYTVNKFNKRLFSDGGGIAPLSINSDATHGVNFNGINPFAGVSYNLTDKVTTPPELDTSGLKGLKYYNNTGNFFTKNKGALMTAGAAIGSIPTGDPRGMWDTADPLYHLAGGRESGVGNAMSDVGVGLAQAGLTSGNAGLALTGGIVKGIGSLFNAAFGIKENKKNTNFIKQNTQKASSMGNVLASAASNEDLQNVAGNMRSSSGFKWDDLYSNGWFTSKGTRLGNNLINKEKNALAIQTHGLTTGARNVDYNLDSNIMRNFGAFGGPLDMLGTNSMGAIGYGFISDYLNNKRQQIEADSAMTNTFAGVPSTMFASGGKIHIKKKNRGKFTETMKRTGKSAEELSRSKNPLTRKRAIFALNSRKWHHADGGPLNTLYQEDYPLFAFGGDMETNIADFSTGATHINAGDSHEENPYEGVQLGTDRNGVPNLVEEGEVVFDDYVYSARIPIDQTTKEKFHINKKKELTYAELAKKLEKEIAERPNDPLSKAGFEAQMHDLAEQQERQKKEAEAQRAKEAFEALTPEEQTALMQQAAQQEQMAQQVQAQQAMQEQAAQQQAPQEMAMEHPATEEEAMMQQENVQADGGSIETPNKFKGGGFRDWWEKYIFEPVSKGEFESPDYGALYKFFTGLEDKSDSHDVKEALAELYLQDPSKFMPYDFKSNAYLSNYTTQPEVIVNPENPETVGVIPDDIANHDLSKGMETLGPKTVIAVPAEKEEETLNDDIHLNRRNEGLRYMGLLAPATHLGMMVGGVGKPDYTRLDNAVNTLNDVSLAAPTFVGDYLKYTPMDIWSEQNRQNASARATDRVITNTNNPARMAGLLASGYNDQLASGDLYRKALEYNDAKRAQIADFNRATNVHNMTAANQTSQFNANAINNNRQHQAALAMQAAKERLDSDASWYNSLYGNINNLYKGLSELGRENAETNWRNVLLASGVLGTPNEEILKQAGIYTKTSSKGGKISKKKNKRRGLTC